MTSSEGNSAVVSSFAPPPHAAQTPTVLPRTASTEPSVSETRSSTTEGMASAADARAQQARDTESTSDKAGLAGGLLGSLLGSSAQETHSAFGAHVDQAETTGSAEKESSSTTQENAEPSSFGALLRSAVLENPIFKSTADQIASISPSAIFESGRAAAAQALTNAVNSANAVLAELEFEDGEEGELGSDEDIEEEELEPAGITDPVPITLPKNRDMDTTVNEVTASYSSPPQATNIASTEPSTSQATPPHADDASVPVESGPPNPKQVGDEEVQEEDEEYGVDAFTRAEIPSENFTSSSTSPAHVLPLRDEGPSDSQGNSTDKVLETAIAFKSNVSVEDQLISQSTIQADHQVRSCASVLAHELDETPSRPSTTGLPSALGSGTVTDDQNNKLAELTRECDALAELLTMRSQEVEELKRQLELLELTNVHEGSLREITQEERDAMIAAAQACEQDPNFAFIADQLKAGFMRAVRSVRQQWKAEKDAWKSERDQLEAKLAQNAALIEDLRSQRSSETGTTDAALQTAPSAVNNAKLAAYEEEISQLKIKLIAAGTAAESLHAQFEEAKKELRKDFEQRLKEKLRDIQASHAADKTLLEDQVAMLQDELAAVKNELSELQIRYSEQEGQLADAQMQLLDAQNSLISTGNPEAGPHPVSNQEEINLLNERLLELQARLDAAYSDAADARSQYKSLQAEHAAVTEVLAQRLEELNGVKLELDNLKQTFDHTERSLLETQAELSTALTNAEERLKTLTQREQELSNALSTISEDAKAGLAEEARLRGELESALNELAEVQARNEELHAQVTQLKSLTQQAAARELSFRDIVAKATSEKEQLQQRNDSLEEELVKLREQFESTRSQLAEERRLREEMETNLLTANSTVNEELARLREELQAKTLQEQNLTSECERLYRTVSNLQSVLDTTVAENSEQEQRLHQDLSAARGEIARVKSLYEASQALADQLSNELTSVRHALKEQDAQVQSWKQRASALEQEIAELRRVAAIEEIDEPQGDSAAGDGHGLSPRAEQAEGHSGTHRLVSNMVDRRLVVRLLEAYLLAPPGETQRKEEIIDLMMRILQFTPAQKKQVEAARKKHREQRTLGAASSIFTGALSWFKGDSTSQSSASSTQTEIQVEEPSAKRKAGWTSFLEELFPATSSINATAAADAVASGEQSLADLWANFLIEEAKRAELARLPKGIRPGSSYEGFGNTSLDSAAEEDAGTKLSEAGSTTVGSNGSSSNSSPTSGSLAPQSASPASSRPTMTPPPWVAYATPAPTNAAPVQPVPSTNMSSTGQPGPTGPGSEPSAPAFKHPFLDRA